LKLKLRSFDMQSNGESVNSTDSHEKLKSSAPIISPKARPSVFRPYTYQDITGKQMLIMLPFPKRANLPIPSDEVPIIPTLFVESCGTKVMTS
jgi:hypothetical protein